MSRTFQLQLQQQQQALRKSARASAPGIHDAEVHDAEIADLLALLSVPPNEACFEAGMVRLARHFGLRLRQR